MTTLNDPLPFRSVVTTPTSTSAIVALTPCRVSWMQLPSALRSVGNWPKVAGNVLQKKLRLTWYSLLGVAPFKVNMTVNLRVGDTDHTILLCAKSSGSPKLSQPVVHFCVVAVAKAAPADNSTVAARSSAILFISSPLLK